MELADTPLRRFLNEPVVPYESDEVTRLIFDSHDASAFAAIAHLTVGEFREWLLSRGDRRSRSCRARSRHHARNGRRCFENHARAGPGHGRREEPRGHEISRHYRPCRTTFDAPAAESSHRRPARHRGQRDRRIAVCERRRGDRRESRVRRCCAPSKRCCTCSIACANRSKFPRRSACWRM